MLNRNDSRVLERRGSRIMRPQGSTGFGMNNAIQEEDLEPQQETIGEEEKKQLFMRKLTCNNPRVPKVVVNYNYTTRNFVMDDSSGGHVLHFSMEGSTILKKS